MKHFIGLLFCLLFPALTYGQQIKIMLVTGGHSYDTVPFFDMFDALEELEYVHFQQPKANAELQKNLGEEFDVLVFYDMWKSISEGQKRAYVEMTKKGKPMLFLHHSIASYQDWPLFEQILGGKYVEKKKGIPEKLHSNFEHDVWVYGKVEKITPVTRGFNELRFFDEIYGNVQVSDEIIPLVKTRHPKSMEVIVWENRFNASNIIYIQPGHDKRTYAEKDYRKLVLQAIQYLAQ